MEQADIRKQEAAREISSLMDEAITRYYPAKKNGDLKKQSQFAQAEMGATSLMQGDYDNMPAGGVEENKANSNPIKANQSQLHTQSLTEGAEKREKLPGAATLLTG
jgi:hypothetical protein